MWEHKSLLKSFKCEVNSEGNLYCINYVLNSEKNPDLH